MNPREELLPLWAYLDGLAVHMDQASRVTLENTRSPLARFLFPDPAAPPTVETLALADANEAPRISLEQIQDSVRDLLVSARDLQTASPEKMPDMLRRHADELVKLRNAISG